MRRVALALALIVAAVSVLPAQSRGRGSADMASVYVTRMNEALAAYTAGNDNAVAEWLKTREGQTGLSFLERVFGPPATFSKQNAAFLLEVAVATPGTNPRKVTALRLGRQLLLSRTELPGVNANDDRFEILWHEAALGLLQDQPDRPGPLDEYVQAITPRLDAAAQRNVTFDSRIPLAQAISEAALCCRPNVRIDDARAGAPPTFESAIDLFTRASKIPALRDEALIRGGVLQFQTEHAAAALEWLDRVADSKSDQLLHYAQSFTRARAFDELNRADEAVTAYEAARADGPTMQTPAIGLAAALMRAGRTDEGVRIAAQARQLPADAPDLWLQFRKADARYVAGWLEEIRRLRK